MQTNLFPRAEIRQIVVGTGGGKLPAGTITPAATPMLPARFAQATVYNAAAYTYTDAGGVAMPIAAGATTVFPGTFVKDLVFAAGTYKIRFDLDA